jgi:acetylornithine/succinyldiaminopimelate/putrescine aminotransferase
MDQTVAALIIEPVQGMAGARACPPAFLHAARKACDRAGAVLIFDEIQCGAGRTGCFTAAEAVGVTPDIITMAKGLASGLPIGAVVTNDMVSSEISTGDLGSTFGGGPVVCAAALATLDVMQQEGLFENVRELSQHISEAARALGNRGVLDVQGLGLLLGLRLNRPAGEVQGALFGKRVITGTASDPTILRLLPPLNFSRSEADLLLHALKEVLA